MVRKTLLWNALLVDGAGVGYLGSGETEQAAIDEAKARAMEEGVADPDALNQTTWETGGPGTPVE
jgi:hypothetical protein